MNDDCRDSDGVLSVIAVDESRGDGLSYNKLLVQEGYATYLYDIDGQLEGMVHFMKEKFKCMIHEMSTCN